MAGPSIVRRGGSASATIVGEIDEDEVDGFIVVACIELLLAIVVVYSGPAVVDAVTCSTERLVRGAYMTYVNTILFLTLPPPSQPHTIGRMSSSSKLLIRVPRLVPK